MQAAIPEMIAELTAPIRRRRGKFLDINDDTKPMSIATIIVPTQREPSKYSQDQCPQIQMCPQHRSSCIPMMEIKKKKNLNTFIV